MTTSRTYPARLDGELDPRNADRIVQTCCKSGEHKDTWNVYHAIGEAIRGQPPRSLGRPERVMEAITHLCPKSLCKGSPKSAQAVTDTTGSLASDAGIVYLHLLLPDPYVEHVPPISDTWGNFGGHTQEQEEPARRTASGKLEPCGRRVCEFADPWHLNTVTQCKILNRK